MAVRFDDDLDQIEKEEGGKGLRARLEAALAENRKLAEEVGGFKAQSLIQEKGFSLVKPEDLAGVKADELEAKAQALQEQRTAERREVVKELLAKRGIPEDQLDAEVDSWLSDEPQGSAGNEFGGLDVLDSIGGRPAPRVNVEQLDPLSKIEMGLSKGRR